MNVSNIAHALSEQARNQPDGIALIMPTRRTETGWEDVRYTYQELDELTDRLAAGLHAHGIGQGTRVAFMVPPSLEFFALFFAMFKAGCVPVLIDPGIGLKPLKTCLAEAEPEVFIGVTRAQVARMILGWARGSIRQVVTVGPRPLWRGLRYKDLIKAARSDFEPPAVTGDDEAAVLFTSGSTGIPKGVVYRHRMFAAQVDLLRDTFGMSPGEVDLPTFPPFALFDPALGMTSVIPLMDFTRPAQADPDMLVSLIDHYDVTHLFGSPALMNTLSRHLEAGQLRLPGVRRALSAGAPVSPAVIERMHGALDPWSDIHTPYGATEALPVATVAGRELVGELSDGNRQGRGICIGRPLTANEVRIISVSDDPIDLTEYAGEVPQGEIGEICVTGPTVTDTYFRREAQTRAAKMTDAQGRIWHRMGDLGWFDEEGRLWFCGRKSERVRTAQGTLYTECVEGPVNAVEGVFRSALVGVGEPGTQEPVIIIEPEADADRTSVEARVREVLDSRADTAAIKRIEFHKSFPVDIRHNAKIRRNQLAEWAASRNPS
ncbi:AMP-binding protein [Wenzhouxiangella sp. AB-CW3]|uniref:fatty acid CoA ligase family protein n=1 Tax=Wenzhouxiangella sp. AB-CW3 TaxID=2771012 RepID=UPI00168B89A8|nr:fatty acid CoA ligase family protein [Wenzhouxiangella sp. AB-CW3]QOC23330.1 AMP-binding protein [Wenzhouxiangella sp. AB-CW3]